MVYKFYFNLSAYPNWKCNEIKDLKQQVPPKVIIIVSTSILQSLKSLAVGFSGV